MHRHKPTASRDFRTPLLIWVCPKMREIKHIKHSQSVGIPEFPRYTHVHCSCKHRYVSVPLICEFVAFIAARLQSFLCTWAIAPANHLMCIHQELPLQWQLPGHGSDINAISTHRTLGCGRKVSASAVPASSGWCYQTSK